MKRKASIILEAARHHMKGFKDYDAKTDRLKALEAALKLCEEKAQTPVIARDQRKKIRRKDVDPASEN